MPVAVHDIADPLDPHRRADRTQPDLVAKDPGALELRDETRRPGQEALDNRPMLDPHRPLERGLITEGSEKDLAAGRPTPLWHVNGAPQDRSVFAGEARGLWLWAIVWPEQSGLLMYDELVLTDLRDAGAEVELLPCGALTPRLLS